MNERIVKELRHKAKEERMPLIFRDLFARAAGYITDLRLLLAQTERHCEESCAVFSEGECDCGAQAWNAKIAVFTGQN